MHLSIPYKILIKATHWLAISCSHEEELRKAQEYELFEVALPNFCPSSHMFKLINY